MYFTAARPVAARRAACSPSLSTLDRVLDRTLATPWTHSAMSHADIQADANGWTVTLDLPGVSKEQLSIEIDGPTVRIASLPDAPRQYRRAYELPQDIDPATSTARLENGVLTLTLAKKVPVDTSTRLAIN
jgi:HSP20 family protein